MDFLWFCCCLVRISGSYYGQTNNYRLAIDFYGTRLMSDTWMTFKQYPRDVQPIAY